MITPPYCRMMAAYGQHMNERLLACCEPLGEEVLREDRGAFFRSIFRTLEHVLFGDRAWMSRFTGQDYRGSLTIGSELASDFASLKQMRTEFDAVIAHWAAAIEQPWLDGELTFVSGVDGQEHRRPRALLVTHMFNHATHHRGQVTTLLSQLGIDVGITDLPAISAAVAATAQADLGGEQSSTGSPGR